MDRTHFFLSIQHLLSVERQKLNNDLLTGKKVWIRVHIPQNSLEKVNTNVLVQGMNGEKP